MAGRRHLQAAAPSCVGRPPAARSHLSSRSGLLTRHVVSVTVLRDSTTCVKSMASNQVQEAMLSSGHSKPGVSMRSRSLCTVMLQELKRYLVAALDQLGQRPAGTRVRPAVDNTSVACTLANTGGCCQWQCWRMFAVQGTSEPACSVYPWLRSLICCPLQGMEALHGFLLRNPGVDLQPFLAGANDRLRTYFYEVSRWCTLLQAAACTG